MHIRVLQYLLALLEAQKCIKDCNGQEVGSDCALERGSYLNHPVHHLCTILLANVVGIKRCLSCRNITSYQVFVNLGPQGQIIILFLLWGRLLSALTKTAITLLMSFNGPCITRACHIFNSNNMGFVRICAIRAGSGELDLIVVS